MPRKILRISITTAATAAAVGLALKFAPAGQGPGKAFDDCALNMTSECLFALGLETASADGSSSRHLLEIGLLGQTGRIDEALAFGLRIQAAEGLAPGAAAEIDARLASHRITAAIRDGANPQDAFARTPGADAGALWISALDLLGRRPYGPAAAPRLPDERIRAIVAEMADMIAAMAGTGSPSARRLADAAELQAALGNREAATRILGLLPKGDRGVVLSEDLVRLIGAETALDLCGGIADCRKRMLPRAAAAAADAESARAYLDEVFAIHTARRPWPDFTEMARVVELAARLGHREHALVLAQDVARIATTSRGVFPSFPHIAAARSLLAAGAESGEVRQALDLAEGEFPESGSKVVGFGIVSGPIQWDNFGLEAQARREIANLRARLGDLDAAIRMMEGIRDPAFAWREVLTPDIPIESLDRLLQAASPALTVEENAYVRACLAQDMVLFDVSGPHLNWATTTMDEILRAEPFDGERAVAIYGCIVRVAANRQDRTAERAALTRMGQVALASGDVASLHRAGLAWYRFETSGL